MLWHYLWIKIVECAEEVRINSKRATRSLGDFFFRFEGKAFYSRLDGQSYCLGLDGNSKKIYSLRKISLDNLYYIILPVTFWKKACHSQATLYLSLKLCSMGQLLSLFYKVANLINLKKRRKLEYSRKGVVLADKTWMNR